MKPTQCPQERAIIAATRMGVAHLDLDRHRATCSDCAEAYELARILNNFALSVTVDSQIPEGTLLWRRMQRRRDGATFAWVKRALSVSYAITAIYVIALFGWFLPWRLHLALFGAQGVFGQLPPQIIPACAAVILAFVSLGLISLIRLARAGDTVPIALKSN